MGRVVAAQKVRSPLPYLPCLNSSMASKNRVVCVRAPRGTSGRESHDKKERKVATGSEWAKHKPRLMGKRYTIYFTDRGPRRKRRGTVAQ
jgi:hypothetical protein